MARKEVEAELSSAASGINKSVQRGTGHSPDPQARLAGNGGRDGRSATNSQVRAIRSICNQRQIESDHLAKERFGSYVDELTLRQASQLIDELKSARSGNGGTR